MRILVLLSLVLVTACQSAVAPADPKTATYTIEKRRVTLANGLFEEPAAPGSAAKTTIRLLDKSASGDLNADGKPDAAVILTLTGGGSGTFYYLAALLGTGAGNGDATNAILLGDRITVESVKVDGAKISVDVLDRRAGEPFTTAPSVKTTRVFQLAKDGSLAEVK